MVASHEAKARRLNQEAKTRAIQKSRNPEFPLIRISEKLNV
jgi:hypothetical protein